MYETSADTILHFARTWDALRKTVTKQVERVLDDYASDTGWDENTKAAVNPLAIKKAANRLKSFNMNIDTILAEYLEYHPE